MRLRKEIRIGIIVAITLVLAAQNTMLACAAKPPASTGTAYTQHEKGLLVDIRTLQRGAPRPSLSDAKAAGFTLVGTYVDTGSAAEWNTISNFLGQVSAAGLRTFIAIYTPKSDQAVQWVKKAASLKVNVNVIELDELVGTLNYTKAQLLSVVDTGLKANPNLQFIVTEFEYPDHALSNVFAWTASYASVRVANDDYVTITYIDLEVSLAQQYEKQPLTWLIFSKGSKDFPCYLNLDSWITYTKERNVDALFYFVDPWSVWQTDWSLAASF